MIGSLWLAMTCVAVGSAGFIGSVRYALWWADQPDDDFDDVTEAPATGLVVDGQPVDPSVAITAGDGRWVFEYEYVQLTDGRRRLVTRPNRTRGERGVVRRFGRQTGIHA